MKDTRVNSLLRSSKLGESAISCALIEKGSGKVGRTEARKGEHTGHGLADTHITVICITYIVSSSPQRQFDSFHIWVTDGVRCVTGCCFWNREDFSRMIGTDGDLSPAQFGLVATSLE